MSDFPPRTALFLQDLKHGFSFCVKSLYTASSTHILFFPYLILIASLYDPPRLHLLIPSLLTNHSPLRLPPRHLWDHKLDMDPDSDTGVGINSLA